MHKIAIAPMLDWTDRHFRYFMRQITKYTELYTEMIVADAILHGNQDKLLSFHPDELPLVVQLGGSCPDKLSKAAKICMNYGYSGINLNVGCPSDRVKSGNFGACLMKDSHLVASCIKSLQDSVSIPVSIKLRIGVDHLDSYEFFRDFVLSIAETGCQDFIIHARIAILGGLSPKENREIPPLKYEYVYRLKQEQPDLSIMINGGIKTIIDATTHLKQVDGAMIGRGAYYTPYIFSTVDRDIYNCDDTLKSRIEIAFQMIPYLKTLQSQNVPLHHVTRHMIGLFHGCPNAKQWRKTVTQDIISLNCLTPYYSFLQNC